MRYTRQLLGAHPTVALVVLLATTACATAAGHPNLDATLWVQTAVEYRANALSVFDSAARDLEAAVMDTSRSAALEQKAGFGSLPPAVVLDIDETVLDNVAYQARLIETGELYGEASWSEWVKEEKARPVPGVMDFLRTAEDLGVTVFFVTNRDAWLEDATRANLAAVGISLRQDIDVVLTRGERAEWRSDKTPRRAAVAERFRILMLFGDDLTDFVQPVENTREERDALLEMYRDYWGDRWRVLPNPTYGSWERALFEAESSLDAAGRTQRKLDALDPDT